MVNQHPLAENKAVMFFPSVNILQSKKSWELQNVTLQVDFLFLVLD